MKENYIPQNQRKKILLLSDDLRLMSGIGCASREFVTGTTHHYNWAQLAGSMIHPEKGKIMDLSKATNEMAGIPDAYLRLYATDGYGNPEILREVMKIEKPDAILHFTDPRQWTWLYQIEREIRQFCPITYLNVWDDLNYPTYNRAFYESCDLLLAISKQTYNINKWVLGPENCRTLTSDFDKDGNEVSLNLNPRKQKPIIHYCPHGINTKTFRPLTTEQELKDLSVVKKELFPKKDFDFVLFYNNRNIRRKQTSTILLAWRMFCDNLTKAEADRAVFLMHTAPIDEAGTDLPACVEAFCPNYNVVFSTDKVMPDRLNQYYNIADVTINLADNEGFGIATAESICAGTPIIVTSTGGLQDQCGFVDENGNTPQFTAEWSTNSDGRYKKHGKWVVPIYPGARMLQGSLPTPYIIADYTRWEDAGDAIMYWYTLGREKRKECGLAGRDWLSGPGGLNSENMCQTMIEGIDSCLANWKGRERFNIHRHDEHVGHKVANGHLGIVIPKIDRSTIISKHSA